MLLQTCLFQFIEAGQRIAAFVAALCHRRRRRAADFVGESGACRARRRLGHLRFGVIEWVATRLARYKAPTRVAIATTTLPRNALGKVDKIALRKLWPTLSGEQ